MVPQLGEWGHTSRYEIPEPSAAASVGRLLCVHFTGQFVQATFNPNFQR